MANIGFNHYVSQIAEDLGNLKAGGILYDICNDIESAWQPSNLKLYNNAYFRYFLHYTLQDLYSIFDFEGIPEGWNREYFRWILLSRGWLGVVNAKPYGWIPQPCTFGGTRNVFAFPLTVIVSNGWFNPSDQKTEYKIGEEAAVIKIAPDYRALSDIACFYADKMAVLMSTFDNSAILSRNGYILQAEGRADSQTITRALESILNGELIVRVAHKMQPNQSITDKIQVLEADAEKHYLCDRILEDIQELRDQFRAAIGYPGISRKKERVQNMEQAALNMAAFGSPDLWIETLQESLEELRRISGINITVKRSEPERGEVIMDGNVSEDTPANADPV